MSEVDSKARVMTGVVVSNKADKTIVVKVERKVRHELYDKYIKRSTKLHAHDEGNSCAEGDVVMVQESRPLSKKKTWVLVKVLEKKQ